MSATRRRSRPPARPAIAIVAVAVAVASTAALSPPARAFLYWPAGNQIERVNLDGSSPQPTFIRTRKFAANAIGIGGGRLFWGNDVVPVDPASRHTASIGTALLDGSRPNEHLSWAGSGAQDGLATAGRYLYLVDFNRIVRISPRGGSVKVVVRSIGVGGRYILPTSLAVDGRRVYWFDTTRERIGRASLDGSHVIYTLVGHVDATGGLAVARGQIYWLSMSGRIGRANVDGSRARRNLLAVTSGDACGLAAYAGSLYWVGADGAGMVDLAGVHPVSIAVGPTSCEGGLAVDGG